MTQSRARKRNLNQSKEEEEGGTMVTVAQIEVAVHMKYHSDIRVIAVIAVIYFYSN